ncbi:hypothetical protein DNTS_031397 [Danionella cerebrum]|uniref:Uncharacterized protein n=1 Tax=Danionella cerebrum TaxID=2873325 RepID=A0A553MMI0_9TELE|nr:hypothetical protein DNTS_031397 [Danionella translucida]
MVDTVDTVDPVDAVDPVDVEDVDMLEAMGDVVEPRDGVDTAGPIEDVDAVGPMVDVDVIGPVDEVDAIGAIDDVDAIGPMEDVDVDGPIDEADGSVKKPDTEAVDVGCSTGAKDAFELVAGPVVITAVLPIDIPEEFSAEDPVVTVVDDVVALRYVLSENGAEEPIELVVESVDWEVVLLYTPTGTVVPTEDPVNVEDMGVVRVVLLEAGKGELTELEVEADSDEDGAEELMEFVVEPVDWGVALLLYTPTGAVVPSEDPVNVEDIGVLRVVLSEAGKVELTELEVEADNDEDGAEELMEFVVGPVDWGVALLLYTPTGAVVPTEDPVNVEDIGVLRVVLSEAGKGELTELEVEADNDEDGAEELMEFVVGPVDWGVALLLYTPTGAVVPTEDPVNVEDIGVLRVVLSEAEDPSVEDPVVVVYPPDVVIVAVLSEDGEEEMIEIKADAVERDSLVIVVIGGVVAVYDDMEDDVSVVAEVIPGVLGDVAAETNMAVECPVEAGKDVDDSAVVIEVCEVDPTGEGVDPVIDEVDNESTGVAVGVAEDSAVVLGVCEAEVVTPGVLGDVAAETVIAVECPVEAGEDVDDSAVVTVVCEADPTGEVSDPVIDEVDNESTGVAVGGVDDSAVVLGVWDAEVVTPGVLGDVSAEIDVAVECPVEAGEDVDDSAVVTVVCEADPTGEVGDPVIEEVDGESTGVAVGVVEDPAVVLGVWDTEVVTPGVLGDISAEKDMTVECPVEAGADVDDSAVVTVVCEADPTGEVGDPVREEVDGENTGVAVGVVEDPAVVLGVWDAEVVTPGVLGDVSAENDMAVECPVEAGADVDDSAVVTVVCEADPTGEVGDPVIDEVDNESTDVAVGGVDDSAVVLGVWDAEVVTPGVLGDVAAEIDMAVECPVEAGADVDDSAVVTVVCEADPTGEVGDPVIDEVDNESTGVAVGGVDDSAVVLGVWDAEVVTPGVLGDVLAEIDVAVECPVEAGEDVDDSAVVTVVCDPTGEVGDPVIEEVDGESTGVAVGVVEDSAVVLGVWDAEVVTPGVLGDVSAEKDMAVECPVEAGRDVDDSAVVTVVCGAGPPVVVDDPVADEVVSMDVGVVKDSGVVNVVLGVWDTEVVTPGVLGDVSAEIDMAVECPVEAGTDVDDSAVVTVVCEADPTGEVGDPVIDEVDNESTGVAVGVVEDSAVVLGVCEAEVVTPGVLGNVSAEKDMAVECPVEAGGDVDDSAVVTVVCGAGPTVVVDDPVANEVVSMDVGVVKDSGVVIVVC